MFIQFFKAGLAYKSELPMNWCPACKTNLTNEELEDGCCERCHGPVEKKMKLQWNLAITKYADRLIDDLKLVDYPERVKTEQINWIGRSHGADVDFRVGDDVMTVYRYSSEEIATLRSMAEEYGIPNVKFITESAAELPTMDEMKEAFLMIASLNNISGSDVELVKKDETTLIFKTKVLNQPRLLKKAAESNSVGYDAGKFVQTAGTHMWLNISVKVTENKDDNNNLNPKPGRQISVNASLEIPEIYKLRGYSVENEKTTWSNQYEDLIIVYYNLLILLIHMQIMLILFDLL